LYRKRNKPASYHEGYLSLNSGVFTIENDNITSCNFEFDLISMVCTDIEDPELNKKLIGHLQSADFFDTEQYPTAKFELTSSEKTGETHKISGNLTIKGITKNISFEATVQNSGDVVTVKSEKFAIDRTEWDIKYNSGKFFDNLKDNVILDEIEISFDIYAVNSKNAS